MPTSRHGPTLGVAGVHCADHLVAFEHVCVYCTIDLNCHDVGSLADPCSDDECISVAVGTSCNDHNKADCPSIVEDPSM